MGASFSITVFMRDEEEIMVIGRYVGLELLRFNVMRKQKETPSIKRSGD